MNACFLNTYDEFVHSFIIIAHKRLIGTYTIFLILHSITFPKQCVLLVFNISDYVFIKNSATLRAFHNLRSHMMCFANKFCDIQSHAGTDPGGWSWGSGPPPSEISDSLKSH